MTRPIEHSSQHDNFLGVMGLLIVGGLGTVLLGSFAGFYVAVTLMAVLWTRTPAARIVTLAAAGYAGLVGLLLMFFGRQYSFAGAVSALIAGAVFWLLLRPGMNEYFGAGRPSTVGKIIPVAPRSGALPHLQQTPAAVPPPRPAGRVVSSAGSTQQQWARLQQQLRAEQAKEVREAAALEQEAGEVRSPFPWLIMVFTIMLFAYASSVGGDFGKASLLLVIPGFIAAMLRWIHPRGFLLAVLVLSGALIVRPDWQIVAPGIRILLLHHGAMVFAAVALLGYAVALCASGFAGDCEDVA